jgi:hypothetical protein
MHSGAVNVAAGADYGYGQTPALTSVAIGATVGATEWNSLFNAMRNCGTHQGTTVVPPLPASGPASGSAPTVYTSVSAPTTVAAAVALLRTNRLNLAAAQTTLVAGTGIAQTASTPWTNTLTFTVTADLGSWNNARYFFNSGGKLNINGSMTPLVTPEDTQWSTMLTNMSPLAFSATATAPGTGTGGTAIGFYQLTTVFQTIYTKTYGTVPYSASFLQVQARLVSAAGTNGQIQFTILMSDQELGIKSPKNGTTTYRIDHVKSSGAIVYPGAAPIITSNGFVST